MKPHVATASCQPLSEPDKLSGRLYQGDESVAALRAALGAERVRTAARAACSSRIEARSDAGRVLRASIP